MGRFVAFAVALTLSMMVVGPVFSQKSAGTAGQAGTTGQAGTAGQAGTTGQSGTGSSQFSYGGISQQPWFADQGVRQQLKLNDDQYNRLNKAWGTQYQTYSRGLGQLNNVPQDQRSTRMNEMNQTFNQGFSSSYKDVLSPEQQQRYNQLYLQYQGYNAFNDPQVQRKLNLTDEQRQKLNQYSTQFQSQQNDINKSATSDRQGASKRFGQLRQRDQNWMNSFLTDEQRQTWRQMTGDPYNFSSTGTSTGTGTNNNSGTNNNQNRNQNQNQR